MHRKVALVHLRFDPIVTAPVLMYVAFTWSSISDDPDFADANAPMPILVADGRAPGETVVSTNATVFEMNPWELGSWDPTLYGFAVRSLHSPCIIRRH